MNKKKILLIVQSVLCVLLTVMLAAAVIGIFREGSILKAADPLSPVFTREKALSALVPVLPLILLSLVTTVVGLYMGARDEKGHSPVQDTEIRRDLTAARVAVPGIAMQQERARQKKIFYGGWALFAVCMVPVLLYITNGDHFPGGDLEPMFPSLIGHVLPWTAIGIAVLMISTVMQELCMQRETEAAREQLRQEKAEGAKPAEAGKEEKEEKAHDSFRVLRIVLLALAVVLIIAGVCNGSARDVFGKAVNICTECIGLG